MSGKPTTGFLSRTVAAWYSRNARVYDRVVTHGVLRLATAGGGRDAIAAWAASVPSQLVPVLDVPTGTGEYLSTLPPPAVGVDLAYGMLHEAADRDPHAVLVHGDAFALPFGDGSFGCVFSSLGLHLMPRPRQAATEMARVLRPGGRLMGAVPIGVFSPFLTIGALRQAVGVPGSGPIRVERRGFLALFSVEKL